MYNLIHPALVKTAGLHDLTRPRPRKQRSARRLTLRRTAALPAPQPANTTPGGRALDDSPALGT